MQVHEHQAVQSDHAAIPFEGMSDSVGPLQRMLLQQDEGVEHAFATVEGGSLDV